MSDYGIASNEMDTISIEEEITLLGLQYSLVTEYTSFVAVDSNAVSTTTGGGNQIDGGYPTDVFEPKELDQLTILGNINSAESLLNLQINNISTLDQKDLFIQITSMNGNKLNMNRLPIENLDGLIQIPLGDLSDGMYLVSLVYQSHILDTEKFIIQH